MNTFFVFLLVIVASFVPAASPCWASDDMRHHPSCPICGMDRRDHAQSRLLFRYDDGSSRGTCSIHCAAVEMALNRHKTVTTLYAADYRKTTLIDAGKAFWVIDDGRAGAMTRRAKWAFEKRTDAEEFSKQHGGLVASFDDALRATFQVMYDDIKGMQQKRARAADAMQDVMEHPGCKYCGMKRDRYAFSRMLVKYNDGSSTGTCSIHCSSIDLALNTDKVPDVILVGDFETRKLIVAEKAVWVIGGKKQGIMTIRGKWAFEHQSHASAFIRVNGGNIAAFEEAMKATFEDMYEILR